MKYSPEIIGEIARRLAGRYVPTDVRNIIEALESTDEQRALRAKLADCQAVIRSRGHAEDCDVTQCCKACGMPKLWSPHLAVFDDYPEYHEFQPGPCAETCGHDRTTGEKA